MLERQVRAVVSFSTEPVREEAFLRLALGREVAPEERPQRGVDLDAVVEPIRQRVDRDTAADAGNEIPAGEGTMRLRVREQAATYWTLGAPPGASFPVKRRA